MNNQIEVTRAALNKAMEMSDEEWKRIRKATVEADATEPRAQSVRYDRKSGSVIVELKNSVVLIVPTRLLQGVAEADPELIGKVQIDARGYGLHWEELDADFSVPGLLSGIYGNTHWMEQLRQRGELATLPTPREIGRKGGKSVTPLKRAASRENGKLGGRPRKKQLAA